MTDSTYTHLALIADRSGSMWSIEQDMNGAIHELLTTQDAEEGTLKVDIVTFDNLVETVLEDGAAKDVQHPVIRHRGSTSLNDAIGQTVAKLGERLALKPEDERPGKVILVIVTDGGENSSQEYTTEAVKKLVEQQQKDYSWEFVFLGANIDAFSVAGGYGISKGSTLQYTANAAGANSAIAVASSYVTRTRSGLVADFTEAERDAAV